MSHFLFRPIRACLAGLSIVVAAAGCDLTENYPLGDLSARVVDQNNVGVQGALLDLYKLENGATIHWRATVSSADGRGVFGASDGGVIEGEYFVRVRFLSLHQLAPGETNDRPVTLSEGDDVVVTFHVVPKEPTLPG